MERDVKSFPIDVVFRQERKSHGRGITCLDFDRSEPSAIKPQDFKLPRTGDDTRKKTTPKDGARGAIDHDFHFD